MLAIGQQCISQCLQSVLEKFPLTVMVYTNQGQNEAVPALHAAFYPIRELNLKTCERKPH